MAEAKKKAISKKATDDSKKKVVKTAVSQEPIIKNQTKVKAAKATKPEIAATDATENIQEAETDDSDNKVVTAKAGKRSAKAIKEAGEKQAKEERKAKIAQETGEASPGPKTAQKPSRSRLERRSKGFQKAAQLIDDTKVYGLNEALELAVKTSPVKFDATVELHVRLGVDPKQADQNIRDTVVLPAGTGKTVRIAVIADAAGVAAAKKAGADIAGSDEFLQELDKGVFDFDILVATPAYMPKLGKHARTLGPKGLMPNPKSGTVTTDVTKAVTEAKAGRVEYRVDSTGIVHVGLGKVSFGAAKLLQNTQTILNSIKQNKPSGLKGNYVKSIFVTTSMGPSVSVNPGEI